MVRLPEAAGQVRNAPVKAIRGFFAGIGQLLLAADRFRAEEAERERADDDEQHDPLTTLEHQPASRDGRPAEPRRFRSLDSTGNVRVLTPAETAEVSPPADAPPESGGPAPADAPLPAVPAARTAPQAPAAAVAQAARAGRASATPQATTQRQPSATASAPAAPAPAAPAPPVPASLPVPGYDGLSLPSLRSRLRVLDVAQLRVLVDYERSNAKRADIVTMFERRIAKLEAAGPDAT